MNYGRQYPPASDASIGYAAALGEATAMAKRTGHVSYVILLPDGGFRPIEGCGSHDDFYNGPLSAGWVVRWINAHGVGVPTAVPRARYITVRNAAAPWCRIPRRHMTAQDWYIDI